MIFVDSSVWIVYYNDMDTPETKKLGTLLGSSPICVGDILH